MNAFCRLISVLVLGSLLACGGGGGGGGGSSYSGTWDVAATKTLDECNSGTAPAISARINVNQNGNEVIVNSGDVTLTGGVNDRDGFTVAGGFQSSGCTNAAAYVFSDASDGDASVGFALTVRCGNAQCTVAYGGRAQRIGRSGIEVDGLSDLNLLADTVAEQCIQGGQGRLVTQDSVDVETDALEAAEALSEE